MTKQPTQSRPLAMVTGASSGIGYELAKCAAEAGFDLIIGADESAVLEAAEDFRRLGADVAAVICDLATSEGVTILYEAAEGRPIDALLANAGHGLGQPFLDQEFDEHRHVVDTNITGTIDLLHRVGRDMRARQQGRVLITGSMAGLLPGPLSAVYHGTKAFIDAFALALRSELKDSGVTVTCLMPGATETNFFERGDMTDTKIDQAEKDDPAEVAKAGFAAMIRGEADIVTGWKNKLQAALTGVTPSEFLAERYRQMAEPGSGDKV